jgi:hypothetical protein
MESPQEIAIKQQIERLKRELIHAREQRLGFKPGDKIIVNGKRAKCIWISHDMIGYKLWWRNQWSCVQHWAKPSEDRVAPL